jgi:hypothetical protein
MAVSAELVPEDPSEVEDRRQRVKTMRLRRLSAKAIAAVLQTSVDVVDADLAWLNAQHQNQYGPAPTIDPSQEIGWAVADFEEMENQAWIEYHSLKQEAQQRRLSPMFVARARQGWIRTAAMMRVLRLKLLAEHGLLAPGASSKTSEVSVARADDIRALLRQEGLLLEVATAERQKPIAGELLPTLDEDERDADGEVDVQHWFDDGGFMGRDFE